MKLLWFAYAFLMPLTVASAHLNDGDFIAAVENCTLSLASFRHGDHLRLAWWYLHQQTLEQALISVRSSILRLATNHGKAHIFHETLTIAWVSLLHTHREETFEQFIRQNENLLTPALLQKFWSPEALQSDAARAAYLPPDRTPLPCR